MKLHTVYICILSLEIYFKIILKNREGYVPLGACHVLGIIFLFNKY